MDKKEIKIKKITEKVEDMDIKGQGCWDDCGVWSNYTTTPKCEFNHTASDNVFL